MTVGVVEVVVGGCDSRGSGGSSMGIVTVGVVELVVGGCGGISSGGSSRGLCQQG